jgi:hypothetical protein
MTEFHSHPRRPRPGPVRTKLSPAAMESRNSRCHMRFPSHCGFAGGDIHAAILAI